MAGRYYNPQKRLLSVIGLEEHEERFRNFCMDRGKSLGEFLSKYFTLWRKNKKGGVSDYEASHHLLGHVPPCWREWVKVQMADILTFDCVTYMPIADFPRLVCQVFVQWTFSEAPPAPVERDPMLELVVQPELLAKQLRLPQKDENEDMASHTTPLQRCQHDDEAGPSRMRITRPRLQMVSFGT